MTETTPRLGLPFIIASQAQKHITHNEALRDLDVLVHLTVEDNTITTPPADASDGQCYVVADGATGDWSGRATQIAVRKDQAWHFYIPKEGWTCWLRSRNAMMVFEGFGWIDIISPNAQRGQSAYELAQAEGFEGTVQEWLASLKGADGAAGTNGQDGQDGVNGADGADGAAGRDGADGKSAYEIAVENGYSGTQAEWLASLRGADGANGADGQNGTNGTDGQDGSDGKSAYQLAVDAGFSGTLTEWLTSLNGTDGTDGVDGANGIHGMDGLNGIDGKSAYDLAVDEGYSGTLSEWLQSLKGEDGADGTNGSSDWNYITNKPRIQATHKNVFENFVSVTNQNVNVTSDVRLKWGTTGVFDSGAVALISNEYVEVKDTAQFTIFGSVGVLDSRTRERMTLTANIYIYDSANALKRRYTLGSMYMRDDASRYDSGIISGHAMLELTAGDRIALAVRRLDAQYSDATYVHPAETRLLIERIDYELV